MKWSSFIDEERTNSCRVSSHPRDARPPYRLLSTLRHFLSLNPMRAGWEKLEQTKWHQDVASAARHKLPITISITATHESDNSEWLLHFPAAKKSRFSPIVQYDWLSAW